MKKEITYNENCHVKAQLVSIKDFPTHYHDDFQIFYILEGELSIKIFYSTYRLQPGSIHIVHGTDIHTLESITEDNLVLVITMDCGYFQNIFPHFKDTVFITNVENQNAQNVSLLRDQIFAIVAEENNHTQGYEGRLNNAAVALINNLMRNFRGFVIDPADKSYIHQEPHDYMQIDRISRVIQYVYENYPYKIRLTEIAEKEGMSPYYLSHIFQKLVGMNFRDFLSLVRIEKSEHLVLETNKSFTTIAQDVGFSDAKYFIRHFYTYLSCHPKDYRRLYKNSVYGKKEGHYVEYPLSDLKPIVSKYTQHPVFKDAASMESIIEIDFRRKSIGELPKAANNFTGFKKIFANVNLTPPMNVEAAKLYKDATAQEPVIHMLENMVSDPTNFKLPRIDLFDSDKMLTGVLTVNGLKKPLYYTLQILDYVPKNILFYGANYMVTQDRESTSILLFNPSKTSTLRTNVVTRNVSGIHKLTKYHLRATSSCLTYWSQLNFQQRLSEWEIDNINIMSYPNVSYSILPDNMQHYTSVELEPYDIMFLDYRKLNIR